MSAIMLLYITEKQGAQTLLLESFCPAELNSNPSQTHLNEQI